MEAKNQSALIDPNIITIGDPITRLGVSLFPLYLHANPLPKIATGPTSGYEIDELPDASVPTLTVINPTLGLVLLVEGQQFVGGDQNRTLNVSVLVPGETSVEIPVSCLERGRWGRRERFQAGPTNAPRRVRLAKNQSVAKRVGTGRARTSDQGAVWASVEESLDELRVDAPTYAIADADTVFHRDHDRREAMEELSAIGQLPGVCGVAVTHGERVVAIEVFGAPHLLSPHWDALVRSYMLETSLDAAVPTNDVVVSALNNLGALAPTDSPGIGLGIERHIVNEREVGHALTLDGSLVHACVLAG